LRAGILHTDSIEAWIDSTALYLDESQQRNFNKWDILGEYVNWNYFVGDTYEEEIEYLKWWFRARSAWLDIHLPGNCPTVALDFTGVAGSDTVQTGISQHNQTLAVIYPNPFTETATIEFGAALSGNAVLQLFNSSGELVKQQSIPKGERAILLSRGLLPAGIYFIQLSENAAILYAGRLLIE
jgi:hypothetical protein